MVTPLRRNAADEQGPSLAETSAQRKARLDARLRKAGLIDDAYAVIMEEVHEMIDELERAADRLRPAPSADLLRQVREGAETATANVMRREAAKVLRRFDWSRAAQQGLVVVLSLAAGAALMWLALARPDPFASSCADLQTGRDPATGRDYIVCVLAKR